VLRATDPVRLLVICLLNGESHIEQELAFVVSEKLTLLNVVTVDCFRG